MHLRLLANGCFAVAGCWQHTRRAADADLLDRSRPQRRRQNHFRDDFAFETTLAGRSYLRLIHRMRAEHWHVELIYLALPSVDMSRLRVTERVLHGGHNTPTADIERRFPRSLANLLELFSGQVNACRCFMNCGPLPELVFEQRGEVRNVIHQQYDQHLLIQARS